MCQIFKLTGYRPNDQDSIPCRGRKDSQVHPVPIKLRQWGPSPDEELLKREVNQFHLWLKLRVCGALSPLPTQLSGVMHKQRDTGMDSECPGFRSRTEGWFFVYFLSPSDKITEQWLKLGYSRFVSMLRCFSFWTCRYMEHECVAEWNIPRVSFEEICGRDLGFIENRPQSFFCADSQ